MFDHVKIRASDRGASEIFYTTVLRTLGIEQTHSDQHLAEWDDFSVSPASGEKSATRGLHVAFVAASRRQVDEFWRGCRGKDVSLPRRRTRPTAQLAPK